MSDPGACLPDEVLERILLEAWRTILPTAESTSTKRNDVFSDRSRYRAVFYASAARTSHAFRRIIVDIPFHLAVFRTTSDAFFYQLIIQRILSAARKRGENLDTVHRGLFARAQVLLAWTGSRESFAVTKNVPTGPYTILSGTERSLIPDASTVVIERWGVVPDLEEWICALPSLKVARILTSDIPQDRSLSANREIGLLPLTKLMRIDSETRGLRAMAEVEGPARDFVLLRNMFSVGPLMMLTKQSLRRVNGFLPAKLMVLVLDTPPGADGVSDVSEWEIPDGLSAGVLVSGIRRRSEQPTIVAAGHRRMRGKGCRSQA
jgi:hypothetical protein